MQRISSISLRTKKYFPPNELIIFARSFVSKEKIKELKKQEHIQKSKSGKLHFLPPTSTPHSDTLKKPKTIREFKNLQKFIKDYKTTPGKSFNSSISIEARRNEEFNEFLKQFKKKEGSHWASITDLTQEKNFKEQELHYKDHQKSQNPSEDEDEKEMAEEFHRRKILKNYFDKMEEVGNNEKQDNDSDKNTEGMAPPQEESTNEYEIIDEIIFNTEFHLLFLDTDAITQVTSQNRINRRRVLLFIGNRKGTIAYGKGKGYSYSDAYQNAIKDCKKNLITIHLDPFHTLPNELYAKYNDVKQLKLIPKRQLNPWGSPAILHMLLFAGIDHCSFICKSRSKRRYAMVYAFFKCVTQNLTPRIIAQNQGEKLYKIGFDRIESHEVYNYMKF